jgi:preprotein translocase subunit SecG
MFYFLILSAHIVVAIALVVLVLLQQGKGADAGAAFGSGVSSSTLFGARGASSFLGRATAILAGAFFLTSLTLAYIGTQEFESRSVVDHSKSETMDKKSNGDKHSSSDNDNSKHIDYEP